MGDTKVSVVLLMLERSSAVVRPGCRWEMADLSRTARKRPRNHYVRRTAIMDRKKLNALPNGHKVASPAAAIAMVCFFLPWVLVSCANQPIDSFSGWELAAGTTLELMGQKVTDIPGRPLLFLVILAGVGVLALGYLALRRGSVTKIDGWGLIVLGALPFLALLTLIGGQNAATQALPEGSDMIKPDMIKLSTQYGLWGVVLGYIAVMVGGVLNLKDALNVRFAPPDAVSVPRSGSSSPTSSD